MSADHGHHWGLGLQGVAMATAVRRRTRGEEEEEERRHGGRGGDGGGWWGRRRATILGEKEVSRVRRRGEGEREVD
jgi:MYXO-CTERM domain-containing protein